MKEKRIIEVNGVKLEVDLTQCRVVENYRVGDPVKVLVKYYDTFKSHAGTIVGFDNFVNRPTIIIAYLKNDYDAQIEFVYFNSDTQDIEICPMNPKDMPLEKSTIVEALDSAIIKKEQEVAELKKKKQFFLSEFGKYFEIEEKIKKAAGLD